jgi:diaminopimelate decarboxylase
MTYVRRNHRVVLTRLGLGGGRAVPAGDWLVELPELAVQIVGRPFGRARDHSAGLEIIGRSAA